MKNKTFLRKSILTISLGGMILLGSSTTFASNQSGSELLTMKPIREDVVSVQDELTVTKEIEFSDTERHWATYYMEYVNHRGIIKGYEDNTFRPNNNISKEEAAVMINRVIGGEDESTEDKVVEVGDIEGRWSESKISNLVNRGIINFIGSNKNFNPKEDITRAEFAVMISNLIEAGHVSIEPNDSSIRNFRDIEEHWAKEEIGRLNSLGIMKGYENNTIVPDAPITRAEACALLSRIID